MVFQWMAASSGSGLWEIKDGGEEPVGDNARKGVR
jgi:hypothetical protein